MSETLLWEKQNDGIAYVIINKPERRNAMDADLMVKMVQVLEQLDQDTDVRVIILKGQGDHFSSGGDLKAGVGGEPTVENSRAALQKFIFAARKIQEMEKPVIAMVKGYAVGGGMSLAMVCDIVFASEDAKFSSNFLKVGITPEMGAMLLMPMMMGAQRAKELWFTGRVIDAAEAKELGFVNRVYTAEEIENATRNFAADLAQMPALPVRITKRITNSTLFNLLNSVMEAELQSTPFCTQTEEHKSLIEAFKNRKK
ncbi:enoyl-CoA hydratase [Desulfitobacterium sp. LBE]|uniref:Enoyl-CoA hydratase/isomerase n=3 Tax=root TaxID=1 RepID=A0A098B869_DESHA|nr:MULTISPECIES: enoyl-CoA hydratase-related protein [Desulfitobacterium]ACL19076.1 Enoyl-CoA hydratase/isomerase [Desulfitobacterium hafniense DCB-2]MEA5025454.1 enoyl-CoA hydratase-related protein [Desulfitobacterium hafniense]TWH58036.1 enoyl-CoA hydratase [Desulfitobacterium sp. LBE]CDX04560.1 Enoyl-CoA hydratase/isomerase [Desulfitobacterium hafniense]